MSLEFRTAVGGELKDVDETKREVLVSFPHDVRDTYDTTFGTDCFRDSFSKRLPAIVWQHNMTEPIGRTISAQVTNRANELVGKFSDFDAVPLAHRAFSQLQDGSLTDASFGFQRQSDEKHPEMRGVTRITKAVMQEWSPVTIGAIPGAVVTGTRAEEYDKDGIAIPSLDEIMQLQAAGVLDRDEARAMIAKLPEWREHIILLPAPVAAEEVRQPDPDDDPAGAAAAVVAAEGAESAVVADAVAPAEDEDDPDDDTRTLAASTSAAIREALVYFAKGTDEDTRQGIALVQAGSVVAGDLLDALGIAEPEERAEETVASETAGTAEAEGRQEERVGPKGYVHGWIKADADVAALHDKALSARGTDRHKAVMALSEHVRDKVDSMEESRDFGPKYAAHKSALTDLDNAEELARDGGNDKSVDAILGQVKSKLTNPAARAESEAEERAAMSDKKWDPKESDYTPAAWKSACLIWDGDTGKLPVKEPDGTVNKAALAAAAGRLGQVDAPDAAVKSAAKTLLSLYGKAGMKAPGSLLGAARAIDDDPEVRAVVVEADIEDAFAIFDRHQAA